MRKNAIIFDLLPCPFCGKKPDDPYTVMARRIGKDGVEFGEKWCICCPNGRCGVRPEVWREDKKAAISAWNKRRGDKA